MKKPFVISLASIAGGGKTTAVAALKEQLSDSVVIYFDDYGDKVFLDRDINDWATDSYDCNEWHTEVIAADIERLIVKSNEFIILDFPFGYLNDCVGKYIDCSVFIDVPLDIALARRIVRDYTSRSQESSFGLSDVEEVSLTALDKELRLYLNYSRPAYERMLEICKPASDLIVDGTKKPEKIAEAIIEFIVRK